MALTDAVVRQAKITTKDYTLSDTGGLLLFVSSKGARRPLDRCGNDGQAAGYALLKQAICLGQDITTL